MTGNDSDFSSLSMHELFQLEAEEQCRILSEKLLLLEKHTTDHELLESLMRAAHSIKGAARIINLTAGVDLAHAIEDVFVAGQQNKILLDSDDIDLLLKGVDLLQQLGRKPKIDWQGIAEFIPAMREILHKERPPQDKGHPQTAKAENKSTGEKSRSGKYPLSDASESYEWEVSTESILPRSSSRSLPGSLPTAMHQDTEDLSLRISAERMNRFLGLASEIQVESRWLPAFSLHLLQLKHRHDELCRILSHNRENFELGNQETRKSLLQELDKKNLHFRSLLSENLADLEEHARRSTDISHRLYQEVLSSRMVPFHSGLEGLPRLVRDLSRELGKKAELKIIGRDTRVDRDILRKIEAPLNHLIRNSLDHGIEKPEMREAFGKQIVGTISLEAYHQYGMLFIELRDDGAGIAVEKIRQKVIERKMVDKAIAANLTDNELLDFLFLPNFSTKKTVSAVSGRGVGLDVVQTALREVRGNIKVRSEQGKGASFELQLPLTLSVIRSLLVEVDNEPYAFPVVVIEHVLRISTDQVKEVEGKPYITHEDNLVGLVFAHKVLNREHRETTGDQLHIVILSDHEAMYGLIVDGFLGIHDLVVQPLDKRLGSLKDISAAAILEDGNPILIFDAEDIIRSMNKLISGDRFLLIDEIQKEENEPSAKRILIVDDSITVREVEKEMLSARGYSVEGAVDGQDAWHTIRTAPPFDLVVTDIDMPRMNGIELVEAIKADSDLENIPVIIVSYKDRPEDRRRGLEAGADYYLTKGSFTDEALVEAVRDLIGNPID